jgi:hypothetical protein
MKQKIQNKIERYKKKLITNDFQALDFLQGYITALEDILEDYEFDTQRYSEPGIKNVSRFSSPPKEAQSKPVQNTTAGVTPPSDSSGIDKNINQEVIEPQESETVTPGPQIDISNRQATGPAFVDESF